MGTDVLRCMVGHCPHSTYSYAWKKKAKTQGSAVLWKAPNLDLSLHMQGQSRCVCSFSHRYVLCFIGFPPFAAAPAIGGSSRAPLVVKHRGKLASSKLQAGTGASRPRHIGRAMESFNLKNSPASPDWALNRWSWLGSPFFSNGEVSQVRCRLPL